MATTSIGAPGVTFPDAKIQASSAIGYGQSYSDVTTSRSIGTTYTNTTGRPIQVNIFVVPLGGNAVVTLYINGVGINRFQQTTSIGLAATVMGIVPAGGTYLVTTSNFSLYFWTELR